MNIRGIQMNKKRKKISNNKLLYGTVIGVIVAIFLISAVIYISINGTNKKIDEEFEKVLKPFLDDYDNFILSYIMPEVIAYYIANSYYRGSMYEGTFLQHYNSAKDLINLFGEDYEQMKAEVFKLLKIKYALIVVNEDPLDLKQIEY